MRSRSRRERSVLTSIFLSSPLLFKEREGEVGRPYANLPQPPPYKGGGLYIQYRRFPQIFGGFFRRRRIDVKPGSAFEARDAAQLGRDLQMPVVKVLGL